MGNTNKNEWTLPFIVFIVFCLKARRILCTSTMSLRGVDLKQVKANIFPKILQQSRSSESQIENSVQYRPHWNRLYIFRSVFFSTQIRSRLTIFRGTTTILKWGTSFNSNSHLYVLSLTLFEIYNVLVSITRRSIDPVLQGAATNTSWVTAG